MLPAQNCPHCLNRVIPSDDRICPACRKDVRKPSAHGLVAVSVTRLSVFPEKCHRCNQPTREVAKQESWSRSEHFVDDRFGGLRAVANVCSAIFLPISISLGRESGMEAAYAKTEIRIPMCESCRREGIWVIEADGGKGTMKIAVHPDFASAMTED